jgi:chemotaxis protein MotB
MFKQKPAPILIVRRRVRESANSRNGAWKLAYADFMTALMALFIVLWIVGSGTPAKKTIGPYLNEGRPAPVPDDRAEVAEKLRQAIQLTPELSALKMQVEISVMPEGVRVDLLDRNRIPLFEAGREMPTKTGTKLLIEIAKELGKLPNRVALEGHTDSKGYSDPTRYTNWELSIDRANAARRLMVKHGLRPDQVSEVFGSADQDPGPAKDAGASENRRVTLIVQSIKKGVSLSAHPLFGLSIRNRSAMRVAWCAPTWSRSGFPGWC